MLVTHGQFRKYGFAHGKPSSHLSRPDRAADRVMAINLPIAVCRLDRHRAGTLVNPKPITRSRQYRSWRLA